MRECGFFRSTFSKSRYDFWHYIFNLYEKLKIDQYSVYSTLKFYLFLLISTLIYYSFFNARDSHLLLVCRTEIIVTFFFPFFQWSPYSPYIDATWSNKLVCADHQCGIVCIVSVTMGKSNLRCFPVVSNNFRGLKETTIRQRSWVRWRASSTEEKVSTFWIRKEESNEMFFPERLVCCVSVDPLRRDTW